MARVAPKEFDQDSYNKYDAPAKAAISSLLTQHGIYHVIRDKEAKHGLKGDIIAQINGKEVWIEVQAKEWLTDHRSFSDLHIETRKDVGAYRLVKRIYVVAADFLFTAMVDAETYRRSPTIMKRVWNRDKPEPFHSIDRDDVKRIWERETLDSPWVLKEAHGRHID